MKILILGGTTEARLLCAMLERHEGLDTIMSLAGITRSPCRPATRTRIGGFGGSEGLAAWLRTHHVDAVIDATHPFAAKISHNAYKATETTGTPLLRIVRPAWEPVPGDRWLHAATIEDAADLLGPIRRRVFLTTGRKDLTPFLNISHDYLLRSIDPPTEPLPESFRLILLRGPFTVEDEMALMTAERIEILVTKNAGSEATRAKLDAARHLHLPVVMVDRPILPPAPEVSSAEAAVEAMLQLQSTRREV